MKKTSLEIAKLHISHYFRIKNHSSYKRKELFKILSEMREEWDLALSVSSNKFIKYLTKEKILTEVIFDFPNRKETRFIRGKVDVYKILMAINDKGYFSHLTALNLNNLLSEKPAIIIWNVEQIKKKSESVDLSQDSITNSFKNKCRTTKNICKYGGHKIYGINGMQTENLGVIEKDNIRYTNLERTLIDIVVRPQYSGGVKVILNAFTEARGKVNLKQLIKYYKKIKYIYPYHQSIGFYLDKSGYTVQFIEPFFKMKIKYDFYLCNQIKNKKYSDKWHLYYPSDLDTIPK